MTLEDFRRRILPALSRFGLTDPDSISDADTGLLWRASTPYRDLTPASRHQVSDARDALLGRWPDYAIEISRNLRANYDALTGAAAQGVKSVRLVVRNDCRCFAVLDGVELQVQDALRAFDGDRSVPLLPSPEAPCVDLESPRVCSVGIVAVPEFSRPGDDVEFGKVLKDLLSLSGSKHLPDDWADRIKGSADQ